MNIEQLRTLFPVTKEATFLNNASQAPLSVPVLQRLNEHFAAEINPLKKKAFDRNQTRTLLSQILGGTPDEYALVTSTGIGMGIVAQGLDFKAGDNIVIPEREHWNNTFPWLQLVEQGVEIRFAKLNQDFSIDPATIAELVDARTRVVTIAAVRFNSGFRPNLAAIGKVARKNGALFVVDVAQAAGMVPINIENDNIDVLAACGFKWLLGLHGTGFLYVGKRAAELIKPVLPGMSSAGTVHDEMHYHEDARKYETGTISYSLFDAWTAGLELLLEVGVTNIYERALEHTDILIVGLLERGYKLSTPTKNRDERTAILHFTTGSAEKNKELHQKLKANKVVLTLQAENLRVSPSLFTNEEDLETFLNLV